MAITGWKRIAGAIFLAIHIFGRLLASNEPISGDDLISQTKIISDGTLGEIKLVLGWLIDTRRFTIRLPDEKFQSWTFQIKHILKIGSVSLVKLESLIDRLNHADFVMPKSRHYLNLLRNLH